MYFTVEEENLICLYHNADRRRTAANLRAALPDMDKEMAALAGGDDQVTLRRLAHSLKGTSTLFGLNRTGNVAATLEKLAAAGEKSEQARLVQELDRLFQASCPLLHNRIQELIPA